ncbi:hypothetical protein [Gracilibacillus xinjiangensis]|uniref:Uncharacterized protein n=1 Tax=Gracilibacillus xinjiangensis TaxID=1193282 RepID=A0ABV8WX97_9BACI
MNYLVNDEMIIILTGLSLLEYIINEGTILSTAIDLFNVAKAKLIPAE